jgi:predicted nucleotidyltransferase component of viral defense system
MYLFQNKEEFETLIQQVSSSLQIEYELIEKDYFVSLFLKKLNEQIPTLVFKGGTSLSKGHKILERFSEDVDIAYITDENTMPTQGQRKKVKAVMLKIIEELGLELVNPEMVRSRARHSIYQINYDKEHSGLLKDTLVVETYFYNSSFPVNNLSISNYLYDYLLSENLADEVVNDFPELNPFSMKVQSLERSFIDKLFAVSDRYTNNDSARNSRHLYDLYYILQSGELDVDGEEFKLVFSSVQKILKEDLEWNPSAVPGFDLRSNLLKSLEDDFFKSDYEEVTKRIAKNPPLYSVVKGYLIEHITNIEIPHY